MRYEKYFSLIVFSFLKIITSFCTYFRFQVSSIKNQHMWHIIFLLIILKRCFVKCAQGRAAWVERGRRCSVSENPASCHRRWVKRNRVKYLKIHLESHFIIHSHLICNRYMIHHWEVHLTMTTFWEHSGGQVHLQMPFCMWVLEPLHLDLLYFAQEQEKKVLKQSNSDWLDHH